MPVKVNISTKSAAQPDDELIDQESVEVPDSPNPNPVIDPEDDSSNPPLDDDLEDDDLEDDSDQPDPDDDEDDEDDEDKDDEDDEEEEELTIAWLQKNVVDPLGRIEQGLAEKPPKKPKRKPQKKLTPKERRKQNRKRRVKLS